MGINVTQTMNGYQFENRENQRNTVMKIITKQGGSEQAAEELMNKNIFNFSDSKMYSNAQLSILKAASQISLNDSLKETLKYLKNHNTAKKAKQPILGELWNLFSREQYEYTDSLEWDIDYSAENIFAA